MAGDLYFQDPTRPNHLHPAVLRLIHLMTSELVADYLVEVSSSDQPLGDFRANHVPLQRTDKAA